MPKEIKFNKSELSNKIKVLTEEIPTSESFALGFCLNVGSRNDPKGFEGLAHFIEHAAFLNTKNRNYKQIASQIESLGAYANAFTSKEYTCFYIRALNKHFNKTFQLLTDIVLNPKYIIKDIEKEKRIIIEEIRAYEDDPEELIFDFADEITFANNGLSHPIVGLEKCIRKMEIPDLESFHSKYYTPENLIISYTGGLNHNIIFKACYKYLQDYNGNSEIKTNNQKPLQTNPQTRIYKRPFHQSHLVLSRLTEGMKSDDRFPLIILNILLGDGMSSRIYQLLREKYGFAYTAYSTLNLMADCGAIYIYAAVEKNKINPIIDLVSKEFKNLLNNKIKKTEINRAKEQIKSSSVMALESMNHRMQTLAKLEFTLGKYEDAKTFINEIDKVTYIQIIDIAEKYFEIDKWHKVILMPE